MIELCCIGMDALTIIIIIIIKYYCFVKILRLCCVFWICQSLGLYTLHWVRKHVKCMTDKMVWKNLIWFFFLLSFYSSFLFFCFDKNYFHLGTSDCCADFHVDSYMQYGECSRKLFAGNCFSFKGLSYTLIILLHFLKPSLYVEDSLRCGKYLTWLVGLHIWWRLFSPVWYQPQDMWLKEFRGFYFYFLWTYLSIYTLWFYIYFFYHNLQRHSPCTNEMTFCYF